jgi:DNA-binding transcriptional LysR family regulator
MKPFDLNLLRVLIALHRERSVTRAARSLGLSQSAISMALRRLRSDLGDPLFVRAAHGVDPTPYAVGLVTAVRPLVLLLEEQLQSEASFDPAKSQRPFSFAMSDVGEMVFLPRLLERLRGLAPGSSIRSVTSIPSVLERDLETGEVDLAIGYFPDVKKDSFFQQRLFTHHFCCLVRRNHPKVGKTLSLKQFLQLGHAVVRPEGRSQEIFETFLERKKIKRNIVLSSPHFMSLPIIIARSDLIATVPHAIGVYYAHVEANLKIVEPPFSVPPIELKQHWHQKFNSDSRSKWLRQQVSSLFTVESDEWR